MLNVQGITWRNANRYRAYPFVDNASLELSDATLLPLDALLDASAVVYAGDDQPGLALVSVTHTPDAYPVSESVSCVFQVGEWTATIVIPVLADLTVPFTFVGAYFKLTVLFGEGIFTAVPITDTERTLICDIPVQPALVVTQNRHQVLSVGGDPAQTYHTPLTGRVYAQEGYNCQIDMIPGTVPVFRISAIYGAGAGVFCDPLGDVARCTDVILRVNGLTPSTEGDFTLAGGPGVNIMPSPTQPNTIVISGSKAADKLGCQNVNP